MHNGRSGRIIRDYRIFQEIDQLLYESPELAGNAYLRHRREIMELIEDEGERAPPLTDLLDPVSVQETSGESLIGILIRERIHATGRPPGRVGDSAAAERDP